MRVAYVYVVTILKETRNKSVALRASSIIGSPTILKVFPPTYLLENVHARNHYVRKNIVNVTTRGLNVPRIASVVTAIMASQISEWASILVCKSKFVLDFVFKNG